MGFKSVYRTLQELFPQVDARILKAAAIEHSKDPDGAVEFILTEVIPHTMEKFDASSAINKTLGLSVECERHCSSACASSSKHESAAACEAAIGSEVMKTPHHIDPPCLSERVQDPLGLTFYDAKDFNDQLNGYAGSKEFTTSKAWEKTHQDISFFPIIGDIDNVDCSQDPKHNGFGETSERQKYRDLDLSTSALSASSTSSLHKDAVSDVSLNNKSSDNCSVQSNVECVTSDSKIEIPEHSCIDDTAFREDIQVLDNADTEESSCLHSIATQSRQVCNTDLLENIIEESKGHKKILLSDVESLLKLMKEVEFLENAAEQARKEAGEGGLEIHVKVDELKSMLNHAREANHMHSGEVYGERAILLTEMKELQSHLLALSDVKEKSLSILDVMRQTLETRLAAAEMERIAAEQEKYEREESDRKALAEQEFIMEKVVEESKILQQEAEENARLREFLMDRGRVVDMLQGEISVICEDVKLLEEKLDNCIPLSQSVSSEQTSCILAPSGPARKSTDSEQLLKHDQPSILSVEPLLLPSAEQTIAFAQNGLLDEGWELFEDAAQD